MPKPAMKPVVKPVAATFGIALLSVIFTTPGGARAAGSDLLEVVLRNDNERRGDYDRLAADWLEALPRVAADFRVELLLRRLRTVWPRMRDRGAIVPALESAISGDSLHGTPRQVAIVLLESAYRRAGRSEDAERLHEARGILESFLLIGPFGKARRGSLYQEFPPERELDLSRSYRDGWQTLEWRPLKRRKPQATIRVFDAVYPARGIVYFLSQVHTNDARVGELHLGTRGRVVVWVNSEPVFDDRPATEYRPSRRARRIQLDAGWNHILVKTSASFWLRLSDTKGDPFPSDQVRAETEGVLHEITPSVVDSGALPPGGTDAPTAITHWTSFLNDSLKEDVAPDGDDGGNDADGALSRALEHLGLGILQRSNGQADLAVEQVEKALELAPDDPFVLHQAARTLRSAKYLPPNLSKNRAKSHWQRLVEVDPGFLPAYVHLGRYLLADDQAPQAATELKKALDQAPGFLYGLVELHRVYHQLDWEADARNVLKTIEQVAPVSPIPAIQEGARYRSRDNLEKAVELYRKGFDLDRSDTSILSALSRIEEQRGRLDVAAGYLRERLQLDPDDQKIAKELASLLSGSGDHDAALATLEAMVESRPWSPDAHRAIAAAMEAAGKSAAARDHYKTALKLAPGDLRLARYVADLEEEDDEFWKPFDEVLEDWVSRVPTSGPLVERAQSICVLDINVVEVDEDGSASEYVHLAFQLLSEEGKDSLASVSTPGEIIALRTLRADGGILEPVAALGRREFVMPGLEPGVFTEYAYRSVRSEAAGRPFRHGPFYFQDSRYAQSFLISRYVLILPAGFDGGVLESGERSPSPDADLVRVEKTTRELADGRRVITFESRNAPRIQRERLMPHPNEYIPNIHVVPRQSWQEIADELRDGASYGTEATPELRRLARELTEGIEDPVDKARVLYDHVNDVVRGDSGGRTALRVLLEKSGDRTTLFKALLEVSGVPSSWTFLRRSEERLPRTNWQYPRSDMFSSTRRILLEPPGHDPVWLTLRYRNVPFGRLPERYSDGTALVLTPRGHRFVDLPRVPAAEYASVGEAVFRLGGELEAEVKLETSFRTESAYGQKDRFRTMRASQRDQLLRGFVNALFPGAKVDKAEVRDLEEISAPLTIAFELTAPNLLRPSKDDLLLRVVRQPSRMVRTYGGAAERKHPYHLPVSPASRSTARIHLGPYRVHRLPEDVGIASHLGIFSMNYKRDGDSVAITRELTMRPGRLRQAEFPAFLEFCEAVDAAERENIVLRKK